MEALPGGTNGARLTDQPERQLPSGANKVERIAQHTRGLFDDITTWIELRIDLVKAEIDEKVQEQKSFAVVAGALAFFGTLAFVFLLVTASLALGAWLGHPAWGFLVVTGFLVVVSLGLLAHLRALRRAIKHDKHE